MKVAGALPWTADLWQRLFHQFQQSRLGHAQLLVGQEGVGKRVLLREFAQTLLCHSPVSQLEGDRVSGGPCGQCPSCHLYQAGSHPDLLMVEPEEGAKQIKIEQIRQVTEFVNTTPQQSERKVVLLGPAEAMNVNASNALLKSLEEPVANVTMLLYSHMPSALLATIRSRCQQHSLSPPSWAEGLNWLQRNSDQASLDSLLRLAKGAPLKALTLSEQDAQVQYMQFCQDMRDLIAGSAAWVTVSAKWKNWDVQWLVEWFYELALDAQKSQGQVGVSTLSVQELNDESQKIGQKCSYGQVNGFAEKVVECQSQLRSQGNPNSVMLVETLVFDWLAMLRQASSQ